MQLSMTVKVNTRSVRTSSRKSVAISHESSRRSARGIQAQAAGSADAADQSMPSPSKKRHRLALDPESNNAIPKTPTRSPKKKTKAGPTRDLENGYWNKGFKHVIGVDEAGRGPLAGPVVAAACIIPSHISFEGVDDSKKLSAEDREELYEMITTHPEVFWHAKIIDVETIDEINILQATMRAMEGSVQGLGSVADQAAVLVDGNRLPPALDPSKSSAIIKGDGKSFVIAAASIIAKVTRDRIMEELDQKWPQYGFAKHKGYGVAAHVASIKAHGPCEAHRRTFAPVKDWYPTK